MPRLSRYCLLVPLALALASSDLGAQRPVNQLSLSRPVWKAEESFTAVPSIRELSDGSVLVADNRDIDVRLIGVSGKTVRHVGRVGSGPGEYQTPTALIALPADSSLLVDRDQRRYVIIDPRGNAVETTRFPNGMDDGAAIQGADDAGNLFVQPRWLAKSPGAVAVDVFRVHRVTGRTTRVATLHRPRPRDSAVVDMSWIVPEFSEVVVRLIPPFALNDGWAVGPTGRIAVVRVAPYHLEWISPGGVSTSGPTIPSTPVRVTDAEKKLMEPKGPPFRKPYPQYLPPFDPYQVFLDDAENVWVRRWSAAAKPVIQWDVFDRDGRRTATVDVPAGKLLVGVTRRFAYVVRTDDDGLRWLERYAR